MDDEALAARAAAGDAAAFDALVRAHTDLMYRVALRVCGDPTDAEDVVQEAWIAAWRALPGFRADAKVSTWLYRVVSNTALAHLRRRKTAVSLTEVDVVDARPTPEGQTLLQERAAAVHRAIAALEPSQRIPLVLRELEGLSYAEVAEVLGVDTTALHRRLHRARVALLAKLKELR
ncbi:RNA polymerase sigma factor [Actinokineospora guangxiensis]|uniref:RNA polymerase sigma factor n=1 Tax=Actinokineospora guangxiensis TaxID=1490288 RepID=A0ABW0EPN0_9PSEU